MAKRLPLNVGAADVPCTAHRARRPSGARRPRSRENGASPRGVALLMVLALLALLGSTAADFAFTSRVDLELAYASRDALQAEYNALSALRMRALILKQARKLQALAQALSGGKSALPIGQMLELIPVECGLINAITTMKDDGALGGRHADKGSSRGADTGAPAKEDFLVGECMATSESEHSKIPINLLRTNIQNRATEVQQMLLGLLANPRLRHMFEVEDRTGTRAESPAVLVQAITDWIDADHTEAMGLGDEDRRYQYLKEPYRAKNAPFDSVAELQLVYGVSDAIYGLLRDHVTVYNDNPAIELPTAPLERILYWGIPASLRDDAPLEALLPKMPVLAAKLQALRSMSMLIPFNTDTLKQPLKQAGVLQLIDDKKLSRVFSDSSSTTWYTLVAEGRMGKTTRRLRAVFQASEGQFYYVRMD